jgi:uncharacterized protein (TIGR04255 family)
MLQAQMKHISPMFEREYPHLSKAPIAEAAIEIRVVLDGSADAVTFDRFSEALADRYPESSPVNLIQAYVHIVSEVAADASAPITRHGVRMSSKNPPMIAQGALNGLLVSRLRPYDTWESLRDETRRVWSIYYPLFAVREVVRIGVRYINQVPMALDGHGRVDLDTMLIAGPKIPPRLPQTLTHLSQRMVIPFPDQSAQVAITQIIAPGQPFITLDIDAHTDASLGPASDEIWSRLEVLHVVKNATFFGSLHEPVWRSFE